MASRLSRAPMDSITATQCSCFALSSSSLQFSHLDNKGLVAGSGSPYGGHYLRQHLQRVTSPLWKGSKGAPPEHSRYLSQKASSFLFSLWAKISWLCVWNNSKMTRINSFKMPTFFLTCDHCYDIPHPHTFYHTCMHKQILKLLKVNGHLNQSGQV